MIPLLPDAANLAAEMVRSWVDAGRGPVNRLAVQAAETRRRRPAQAILEVYGSRARSDGRADVRARQPVSFRNRCCRDPPVAMPSAGRR
jgi:hypothetical protein